MLLLLIFCVVTDVSGDIGSASLALMVGACSVPEVGFSTDFTTSTESKRDVVPNILKPPSTVAEPYDLKSLDVL